MIEVCLSPVLYPYFKNKDAIVVVVDILRATSSICTAFHNGVNKIIPVNTTEEAQNYKNKGYFVAAERDGVVIEFADIGNSPHYFSKDKVKDKTVVYTTTNGTNTIQLAKDSYQVLIGSFINITAISEWIAREKRDVLILCAGWKKKFNIEDTLFAGALVEKLITQNCYNIDCDSALASVDLWQTAKKNLNAYVSKINWRKRLDMQEVLDYCIQQDLTNQVPVFENGILISGNNT